MNCTNCEKSQASLTEALQGIKRLEAVVAFERKRADDAEESLRAVRSMLRADPVRKFETSIGVGE